MTTFDIACNEYPKTNEDKKWTKDDKSRETEWRDDKSRDDKDPKYHETNW